MVRQCVHMFVTSLFISVETDYCVFLQLFIDQILHQDQVGGNTYSKLAAIIATLDVILRAYELFPLLPGSQCVDKLYANLHGARVPLNVFSSWGGVTCHVKLTSVPSSLIRLTITSFLIEPSDCVNDALTVYDALLPMRGRILHR